MQTVKGTADFVGDRQALRKRIRTALQETFELYDFGETETAILNERDVLASKYAGGDEILKEMYRLSDQGGRELGLRYDLTIPFAKTIALHPGLAFPFKRYEIGKVFRDGPVKKGRMREFAQCDADVVGIAGPEAEAELMLLAAEAFRRLDAPVTIRWNNRRFLGELLEAVGVRREDGLSVMLTLDKADKIGADGVANELAGKAVAASTIEAIAGLLAAGDSSFEALAETYGLARSPGAEETRALEKLLLAAGLESICRFDARLSRGLSFYTGTVYEIYDATGAYASSLGAGGRYDAIVGKLAGREDAPYPTVGLSFGLEAIAALLESRPVAAPAASVAVVAVGDTAGDALRAAAELRRGGIRAALDTSGRKLAKTLAAASDKGIPFVLLVGEDERRRGTVRLKDMRDRSETGLTMEEALHVLCQNAL